MLAPRRTDFYISCLCMPVEGASAGEVGAAGQSRGKGNS